MHRVDLHTHSSYSDGYFSPKNLFKIAADKGLDLFSITDHDTIESQKKAFKLAKKYSINYISGVEISCQFLNQTIHIVGLDFDCNNQQLIKTLKETQKFRKDRAKQIAKLIEDKTNLTGVYKKLSRKNSVSSRLHFAEALVDYQISPNCHKAFKDHLIEGKDFYVKAKWIDLKTAIEVIKNAGGRAVLAHPLKYKMSPGKLRLLFKEFKDCGGDAVEALNGRDIDKAKIKKVCNLANYFSLALSCGSDFHHRYSQQIGIPTDLLPNTPKAKVWNYFK